MGSFFCFAIVFSVFIVIVIGSNYRPPLGANSKLKTSRDSLPHGTLLPQPQQLMYYGKDIPVAADTFQFADRSGCNVVRNATKRYFLTIFPTNNHQHHSESEGESINSVSFVKLAIEVTSKTCEEQPYYGMQENYTLQVFPTGNGVLKAPSVWGVLRGLETFSQLIYVTENNQHMIRCAEITDWPRFPHRGLLLDTSRHFISKKLLLKNIDLLAINKYNVFHWHIVDDQSFPYESKVFPEVTQKGAFTAKHVYTQSDIADIIEYARVRGVRVVPEFDTPGHTESWGIGRQGLLTQCFNQQGQPDGNFYAIDPTNLSNYDFVLALLTEVMSVFPDKYIHLGGDEVDFSCWKSNPNVRKFMELYRFGDDFSKLEQLYIQKLLWLVERARNNTDVGYMVWQEVFDNNVQMEPDTIVHVWKDGWQNEMATVTARRFKVILSSCWYLNYFKYPPVEWADYYACDPENFSGSAEQKQLVIGGETCMWGEMVDGTNVIARTWPRSSVVAERLWSSAALKDPNALSPRLEEHRCRMLGRGYQVEPPSGPGFCFNEWMV